MDLFTEHRYARIGLSWANTFVSSLIPAQAALKQITVDGATASFIFSFAFLQQAIIVLDDALAPVDSYKKEGFRELLDSQH